MPKTMSHFKGDIDAIVDHSYSDAFGGDNVTSYAVLLLTPNPYRSAWYYEEQLSLLSNDRDKGEKLLQRYK